MWKLIDEDYKAIDLTVKTIQDMRMRNKIKTICKSILSSIISITISATLVSLVVDSLSTDIKIFCLYIIALSNIIVYVIAKIWICQESHFTNHDLLKMECKVDKASL